MTKFSIISPVYNVEKYLDACIKSVVEQDFEDFEMLLVDDGSSDGSYKILEKYANIDARIKIFSKKNEGQGVARNYILPYATGDYILYLDPDDLMEKGALSKLNRKFKEDNYDIVFFNVHRYYEKTAETDDYYFNQPYYNKFEENVFNWESAQKTLFKTSGLPFKAFSRRFLLENDIKYSPTKFAEDNEFYIKAILKAKKMVCLNDFIYTYRIREDSSTSKVHLNIDTQKNTFYTCEKIFLEHYKKNPDTEMLKAFLINRYNQLYHHFTKVKNEYRSEYYKMLREVVLYIYNEYYLKMTNVNIENSAFELIVKNNNYHLFLFKNFLRIFKQKIYVFFKILIPAYL